MLLLLILSWVLFTLTIRWHFERIIMKDQRALKYERAIQQLKDESGDVYDLLFEEEEGAKLLVIH